MSIYFDQINIDSASVKKSRPSQYHTLKPRVSLIKEDVQSHVAIKITHQL